MKLAAVMITMTIFSAPFAGALTSPVRWTASLSQTPSKKEVLAKLKTLQDQQIQEGTDLENAIRKQLNETLQLNLNDDNRVAGNRTTLVTKKIDELNKRRSELNSRREIVDRLIFQIDTKWDGRSKLQDFLVATFLEMASTDLADGRDNRLWKEFTYLSMVMREVPEANDDVIAIFEGYLKSSNVLDPKSPADFIASRNYTNGLESQAARVSSRDSAGDQIPGASRAKSGAPLILKTTIPSGLVSKTPGTVSGATTPYATPPVQATPAAPPHVAAQKTAIEKAQALTGQATMPAQPAGAADSPAALEKREQARDQAREKAAQTR